MLRRGGYLGTFPKTLPFGQCLYDRIFQYKGQLISKANFLVLIWTKNPTNLFFFISALASEFGSNQKSEGTLITNGIYYINITWARVNQN